ncbi:MAG: hypothetical protein C4320_06195 [Armatimonadota bacterium]
MIVFAFPDASAAAIRVEAVIALPALSRADRLILSAAARTALRDTKEYGRRAILAISPDGTIARVEEDYLHLSFTFVPERTSEGLSLLESALLRPALLPESLAEATKAVAGGAALSPWSRARRVAMAPAREVSGEEARGVWERVVRPERLAVAFSGPGSEVARERWLARPLVFAPIIQPRYAKADGPLPLPAESPVAVLEMPAKLDGATLLAVTALGSGKGSLTWRVLRSELGISYRPEASLAGTTEGWDMRLRFDVSTPEEAATAREALAQRIETLTEEDRRRALGYLGASLRGQTVDSPFDQTPAEVANRPFMTAYLVAKGLGMFDPVALADAASRVSLAEMKEQIRIFLNDARIEIR